MTVRARFLRAMIAGAVALALVPMTGCAPSTPKAAADIGKQAQTMTPLQIRMAESLGTRLTKLSSAKKWSAEPLAVTLHDSVIVIWVNGHIADPEVSSAKSDVSDWLQGYQGSGIDTLEFKDYASGGGYGQFPVAAAGQ